MSRVLARERVVMAPWSECDVPVKVVSESWRMAAIEWVFEPQNLAEGVHAERTVLPAEGGGVAVHNINETQSPFTVDAGHEVGHANMAANIRRSIATAPSAMRDLNILETKGQSWEHVDGEHTDT